MDTDFPKEYTASIFRVYESDYEDECFYEALSDRNTHAYYVLHDNLFFG
jgi:hypothetical protein